MTHQELADADTGAEHRLGTGELVGEALEPAAGSGLVVVKPSPFNAETAISHLEPEVTTAASYYVRSNFAVPDLAAETHRILVEGAVDRPLSLTLTDLHALGGPLGTTTAGATVTATIECAGNNRLGLAPLPSGEPWQSGAVSTARWTGVALGALLQRAGVRGDVVEILVEGADRGRPKDGPSVIPFARSLPLEKALHPDTILAWEMNGAPLPPDHGSPVRLVVPAWYGMASVKWVARIEALSQPFQGYYQAKRYIFDYGDGATPVPVTEMRVKSLVVSPLDGQRVPSGGIIVRGRAWSGQGAVVSVEVAVDGGEHWHSARLLGEPAPYVWRSWEYEWDVAEPGRHAIRSRAVDSQGNRQPEAARWNTYGYGSNAIRPVVVYVV